MHYQRLLAHGDPGEVASQRQPRSECSADGCARLRIYTLWCQRHYELNRPDVVRCSIDGCKRVSSSRGWCRTHYERWRRTGEVSQSLPVKTWHTDNIGYGSAHDRVKRRRGLASQFPCDHCGGPADEWAYDHSDPDERRGDNHGVVVPYSVKPAHYIPLCVTCHRRFDARPRQTSDR